MGITIKRSGIVLCALSGVRSAGWHGTVEGERTFSFTVPLSDVLPAAVGDEVVFDSDIFDIVRISKQTAIPEATAAIETEHVSYRLADMEQDAAVFTGTAAAVLGQILSGTGFTVGTVSVSGTYTLTVTENTNKRDVLQQWVSKVGGELQYSGMSISIVPHVGSSVRAELSDKRNVQSISVTLDSRSETQTYGVTLYRETALHLGDEVSITYPSLGLAVNSRIIAMDYDPFQQRQYNLTCGEYVPNWTNSVISSLQEKVGLEKKYYGNTISREYGFKSELDSGAYGQFNADGIQFTDENGQQCLYYDANKGTFVFDGTLGANAMFTESLYAENGDVAELTVDRLSTSRRVKEYLLDTYYRQTAQYNDDNYVRIEDKSLEFVTGSVVKVAGVAQTEQLENRKGVDMYWSKAISSVNSDGYPLDADGAQIYITEDVTENPVTVYQYAELVKLAAKFELVSGVYVPRLVLGAGDGEGGAQAQVWKDASGLRVQYTTSGGGRDLSISMTDDGYVDIDRQRKPTQFDFSDIDNGTFTETVDGGASEQYTVTRDEGGYITSITDSQGHETEVVW